MLKVPVSKRLPRELKSVRRPFFSPAATEITHGAFAGAVVARREHADDALLVGLVGGDVDRIGGIEGTAGAPGIADHAHRGVVAVLVDHRVVEAADRVEHQQHRARTVAHQARARRDAAVQAVRLRAGAADDAGAVRAMAGAEVGLRHALGVGDRQHRVPGRQVGGAQGVLHQVRAVLQVGVRAVDTGVVDHDGDALAAVGDGLAEVVRVVGDARGAGNLARLVVVVGQLLVREDRDHVRLLGQRVDLRRRGEHAGDRQGAQRAALVDADRLHRGQLGAGDGTGVVVADDDVQFLGRGGRGERLGQVGRDARVGEGNATHEHAGRQGRELERQGAGLAVHVRLSIRGGCRAAVGGETVRRVTPYLNRVNTPEMPGGNPYGQARSAGR
jgi:hypothetical protein